MAALPIGIAACDGGNASTTTGTGGGGSGSGGAPGTTTQGTGGEGGPLFVNGGGDTGTTTTTTANPGGFCESDMPTAGEHIWSMRAGNDQTQTALGVAADAAGDLFVVGALQGSLTLGATTLNSAGGSDAFVSKLSGATGTALWAKSFGDGQQQFAEHVAADGGGNMLVAGHFRSSINLGGQTLSDTSNFFDDLFVAKFDGAGNHVWSKRYGDINSEQVHGIATDSANNVVVVGAFQKSINFGGGAVTAEDGGFNAFVGKLSSAGDQLWSKSFGDTANEQKANGVAIDKDGNVLVVGQFKGTIDLGTGPLTAMGDQSAFVAKIDGAGTTLWAKSYGDGTAAAIEVATDSAGNVFVIGQFKGTINLGGSDFSANAANNVFVARLAPGGTHLWSRSFGDGSAEEASDIAVQGTNALVLGTFLGSIDFGNGKVTSAGGFDIFLGKLDGEGCAIHTKAFGDPMLQRASALTVDAAGNTIFVGSFAGAVDFGGGALTSAGAEDLYVVKLKP